jgi:VWFA-related protein
MRRLLLLALLAAVPQSTFRSGVDLVQVDVSVLDKDRHPVRDLTAADFTLFEDGKPRPIAAFTFVELPARAPAPEAPWTRDVAPDVATNALPQEGRLVVILMDRTIPDGYPTMNARAIAKAAVNELGPGDLAAVVYTGDGLPHDFTNNRADLLRAVDRSYAAGELSDTANTAWGGLMGALVNPSPVSNPGLAALNFSAECHCGACVLDAVRRIAEAVRDAPRRRKTLLFIGRDLQVETTEPICVDAVHKSGNAMFKALDLANLTVHSFDPGGLETLSNDASWGMARTGKNPATAVASRMQQNRVRQGDISVLPDRTGGRTILNTNNPASRVPEIFAESDSYYLLGFQPAAADGLRHDISVKVKRRGLDVRTRRGYVAAASEAAPAPAGKVPIGTGSSSLQSAVAGIMPVRDGIALSAHASAFADPKTQQPVVTLSLHVQHEATPAKAAAAAESESVEVLTEVLSMTGRIVGVLRQQLVVKPRTDATGETEYDILQRMPAKPGRYELRVGLRNDTRRQTGSVYTFVDIPDYRRSSFVAGDIELYAPPGSAAMAESVRDVLLAPPTARRTFERGEHVTAFVQFHQASPAASVAITAQVVDEHNRRQYGQDATLAPSDFKTSGRGDYIIDLPIAALQPGAYLLTIDARTPLASERRDVRFSVK